MHPVIIIISVYVRYTNKMHCQTIYPNASFIMSTLTQKKDFTVTMEELPTNVLVGLSVD